MEKNPSNSDLEINDQPNDDSSSVGRSYECTFCKHGFTNAQALGGHMNIHRKDKAKAKAKNHQDESSTENYLRYFTSHEQQSEYYRGQVNYQVYLPSPNPNVWKQQHDSHQGHVDSNLSLKIGISSQDVVKDNEVDLELRLGHDP